MATGFSPPREFITDSNPTTIVFRHRSRSLALAGIVIGSPTYSSPFIAPNTMLVPPASRVRTILESLV